MTENELQQLSKDVAEKHGIEASTDKWEYNNFLGDYVSDPTEAFWLHEDSARCFDLFTTHRINVFSDDASAWAVHKNQHLGFLEYLSDYSNNVPMACRVAGLKALLAKD